MKKILLLFVVISVSLIAMTLFRQDPDLVYQDDELSKTDIPGPVLTPQESNNIFALKSYRILAASEKNENIFISPYSISSALAMTFAGSSSDTEREMANALEFFDNSEVFHKNFGELTNSINSISGKGDLELNIANSLWLSKGYAFLDRFLRINKDYYRTEITSLDFSDSEASRNTINDWVAKKTQDKILDLIPEGVIDALTRLVLTNAVYFKAEWAEHFKEHLTREDVFFTMDENTVKAEMMNLRHSFRYMENNDMQFIELPYKGRDASMYVLLPKSKNGLSELEHNLSYADLISYEKALESKDINLFFPKFKMSLEYELKNLMREMGMIKAFTTEADFSKMNGKTDLYISAIIHKTFVAVDEKGTEAAAATAVVMRLKSVMPEPEYITFKADHPFFYYIKENITGTILFAGRVTDPSN